MTRLSSARLQEIVTAAEAEYRPEAVEYARAELTARGAMPAPSAPAADQAAAVCLRCGGSMRPGTLVGEREVVMVFSDNHEERFIVARACAACGHVTLEVDYDTDVPQ
jgi:hypothetical protein